MFVYEVKPGDTLYGIAMRYRLSPGRLRQVNKLTRDDLTVGQALLVPSHRYIVQPGDTPERIAARTGVPWAEFGRRQMPAPGQVLMIPWREPWSAYVRGYLPLLDPGVTAANIGDWDEVLTDVCLFAHIFNADGTIRPLNDRDARDFTLSVGAAPFACVANIGPGGVFSAEVVDALLENAEVRRTAIQSAAALVAAGGYAGLDVDLERVSPADRQAYPDFLRALHNQLGAEIPLSIAVSPQTADRRYTYAAGLEYGALAPTVDLMFLMAYDFHWVGGPPGAIAPLPSIVEVLDYAAQSGVPGQKLLLGISTAAYDWPISGPEPRRAQVYSGQEAVAVAVDHFAEIRYDSEAEAPWFRYTDESGVRREVWFQDARSLLAKLCLARDRGLRGIGFWHLALISPQAEALVSYWIRPQRPRS